MNCQSWAGRFLLQLELSARTRHSPMGGARKAVLSTAHVRIAPPDTRVRALRPMGYPSVCILRGDGARGSAGHVLFLAAFRSLCGSSLSRENHLAGHGSAGGAQRASQGPRAKGLWKCLASSPSHQGSRDSRDEPRSGQSRLPASVRKIRIQPNAISDFQAALL